MILVVGLFVSTLVKGYTTCQHGNPMQVNIANIRDNGDLLFVHQAGDKLYVDNPMVLTSSYQWLLCPFDSNMTELHFKVLDPWSKGVGRWVGQEPVGGHLIMEKNTYEGNVTDFFLTTWMSPGPPLDNDTKPYQKAWSIRRPSGLPFSPACWYVHAENYLDLDWCRNGDERQHFGIIPVCQNSKHLYFFWGNGREKTGSSPWDGRELYINNNLAAEFCFLELDNNETVKHGLLIKLDSLGVVWDDPSCTPRNRRLDLRATWAGGLNKSDTRIWEVEGFGGWYEYWRHRSSSNKTGCLTKISHSNHTNDASVQIDEPCQKYPSPDNRFKWEN
jgi:hypothetical protein